MSLKIKLPLVVTFTVLLSALGLSYFLIRHEQNVLREELRRRGELLARQLAGIDRVAFYYVASEVKRLHSEDSTGTPMNLEDSLATSPKLYDMSRFLFNSLASVTDSILVVGNDTLKSWVLSASFFDWEDSLVISRPQVASVVLGKPDDGFTFVSPIFVRKDTLGFAQVRMDPKVLEKAISDAFRNILPIIIGILAFSVLLSWVLSALFTSPVSKLQKQALSLASGDLAARVEIRSRDELGLLGRVFNDMARNLQLSYDELKEKLVEIKRLFKMATEDGLTGLYVKRYFLELLSGELRRSIRYSRPLSVLMCDIDHFKRVNDTYGHPAGDVVLRSVARRFAAATRDGIDVIGRYGGEEFAVMLPETDEESAWRVAERLRRYIESEPVSLASVEGVGAEGVTVTISIGVTTITDETTLERVIAAADKALYASKEAGRNRSTSLSVELL